MNLTGCYQTLLLVAEAPTFPAQSQSLVFGLRLPSGEM